MNFGWSYGRVLRHMMLTVLSVVALVVHAEEAIEPKPIIPMAALNANWIFSGSVSNEAGEAYEYFFQAKRHDDTVRAIVSLVDAQSKAVIFIQNVETHLTAESQADHWVIGDAFLRYNAINSSWVFGIKKENQIGFNFKVDMLNQPDHDPRTQNLQQGVKMTIVQTGQVNGHLQLKENEPAQFVSGNHAWFRQIMVNDAPLKLSEIQGLFCRFDDGSGLYSMKVVDGDITRGTFSGFYNTQGASAAVSQFIHIDHLETGPWRVHVPFPKLQFELSNILQDQAIVLGFINKKETPGFCVIHKESLV